MGFGRVIAAAAAASPIVRNYRARSTESEDSEGTLILPRPSSVSRYPQQETTYSASDAGEEMARRPLLEGDSHPQARQSSAHNHAQSYGTIVSDGSALRTSPERYRRDSWLDRVPEEAAVEEPEDDGSEAEVDEWDLAQQGYYTGSYRKTIASYTLVPITSLLVFVLLAVLPAWFWPVRYPSPPTLPRSLPSPTPEFILSVALWSLSHQLRIPLYNLSSRLCPRILDTLVFNTLHVLLSQLLRLAGVGALRVRHEMAYPRPTWHDGAFRSVWWLALGWGVAEAATSMAQGYHQLALYRNVMVPAERVREMLARSRAQAHWGSGSGSGSREYMPLSPRSEQSPAAAAAAAAGSGNGTGAGNGNGSARKGLISVEEAIRSAVDQDVEQLINLQEREELEEIYGLPVIYIPVFVPCLQRLDSFLFSLGSTLILSWAYVLSPLSFPVGSEPPPIYSNRALCIAFPLVVVVHLLLSLLHSPPVLPRIGVHTTAYVGLLVGLGGFFTGLGLWNALS